MGFRTDEHGNRGTLTNDLFVVVRSPLAPVAEFLASTGRFDLAPGAVAAEVVVTADPAAPQKRFVLDEYYTRIVWHSATHAEVATNGATGSIDWSGRAEDVAQAELRIFPEGAPESLGFFLRLLASLLLPSRRGVLIHASGVIHQGHGLIFLGESGAGKTTTARRAGREGALRIADDLAIVRIQSDERISVEACCFDRGGRLPGRAGMSWPLRAAYDVRKGATRMEDIGALGNPLTTWCAAIISSTGPPGSLNALLSLVATLSLTLPPRAFYVSPAGPVLPVLTLPTHHEQFLHASPNSR
ncbi:MAG: hypothetical protein WDO69_21985 [Pseudomonadota bacterium]